MSDLETVRTMTFKLGPNAGFTDVAQANRKALIDAFTRTHPHELGKLFDLLALDVVLHEANSLPYGGVYNGIEDVRRGVQTVLSAWSEFHAEVFDILASGDLAIVYHFIRAKSRATGEWFEGPVAELFRFRDSKIVEWRPIYWDTYRIQQICPT